MPPSEELEPSPPEVPVRPELELSPPNDDDDDEPDEIPRPLEVPIPPKEEAEPVEPVVRPKVELAREPLPVLPRVLKTDVALGLSPPKMLGRVPVSLPTNVPAVCVRTVNP